MPTPRGGGLVVAVVTIGAYLIASVLLPFDISWGFVIGASIILLVSWLDDVYSVSFIWRLIVQSAAAIIFISSNGNVSMISFGVSGAEIEVGRAGALLTFCWIVWLVNAYNFMDGIDGIAGTQALTAGAGWLLLGFGWQMPAIFILGGTLLFVSVAFLLHNWPPARIFMGDAGSAFLGFVFAALPLLSGTENGSRSNFLPFAGVLFVWMFLFDSVFTFVRRILKREKVWNAHREHLYQRLVISGLSHRTVTILYGALSALITTSVVAAAGIRTQNAFYGVLAIVVVISALVLLLCWKRRCLFGEVRY